eukprot:CAMPEP_0168410194 /NCGR_PEP_ID=MMETSP0228-20121227/27569_1 /TAXON_ID=133427 /ORGANISM="Protoceratium reticulatum, Strain CCCM 535 (=CCMP 1889)" /LENGTH=100 /DNA_ID=CAMNT_0008423921 /DNA_START=433 /DNA_END=731 /DNA_ORIENTATION=-
MLLILRFLFEVVVVCPVVDAVMVGMGTAGVVVGVSGGSGDLPSACPGVGAGAGVGAAGVVAGVSGGSGDLPSACPGVGAGAGVGAAGVVAGVSGGSGDLP